MSISSNYPAVRPTLLLDFANTKTLDPRISFTRASIGTYYDGRTVAKAEENLFVQSDAFDSVAWSKTNTTATANTVAAPDGTTTADTITNTTATGAHTVDQSSTNSYSVVTGQVYTISIYAKKNTNDFLQITTYSAANAIGTGRANFNLATGVVGTVDQGTSTIVDVGNGWYRCTYTASAAIGSGTVNIYFGIITSATAARFESYTGAGTESVYLWGAQIEQRSAVTAYTPTTTATVTNYNNQLMTAASGVARFDHNPITDESLGLLIEEARTNLWVYSEDITNAGGWGAANATRTATTTISPSGSLTANTWTVTANGASTLVSNSATITAGATVNHSLFIKKSYGTDWVYLSLRAPDFNHEAGVFINISTGAIGGNTVLAGTQVQYVAGSAIAQSVSNGWYRISASFTTTVATAIVGTLRAARSNGSISDPLANDSYFIWGRQGEVGAFPTSYIPTTTAAVTRPEDVVSMSGTNFNSWYSFNEGTLYAQVNTPQLSAAKRYVQIDDGTDSMFMATGNTTTQTRFRGTSSGGTAQYDLNTGTNSSNSAVKAAGAYKVNDFALSVNGSAVVTDTAGSVFTPTTLRLGQATAGSLLNGWITKFAYYPKRLTDNQLKALTTI